VSSSLIVELAIAVLNARPVNSGVGLLSLMLAAALSLKF
jgi:hypothetical protein